MENRKTRDDQGEVYRANISDMDTFRLLNENFLVKD